jgi:glutaredoxin
MILLVSKPVVTAQSQADVAERMRFYNRALGVECAHCHVENAWADRSKPAFETATNMARMVAAVNERIGKPNRVTCWTCHGGATQPARQPRPALDAELEKWSAALEATPASLRTTMAVYNVALGTSCDHCHATDWKDRSKPAMRMLPTMNALFEIFPKYMPASARTQCYLCHKGSTKPASAPPEK